MDHEEIIREAIAEFYREKSTKMGDQEVCHSLADEFVLNALRKLGHPYSLLAVEWENTKEQSGGFWYA